VYVAGVGVRLEDLLSNDALEIVPLGGVGEFGMNMMAVSCGDTTIVIDAGVMFPGPDLLGVDLIVPDLTYLQDRRVPLVLTRTATRPHRRRAHVGRCRGP
jgi:ribonuclease J